MRGRGRARDPGASDWNAGNATWGRFARSIARVNAYCPDASDNHAPPPASSTTYHSFQNPAAWRNWIRPTTVKARPSIVADALICSGE